MLCHPHKRTLSIRDYRLGASVEMASSWKPFVGDRLLPANVSNHEASLIHIVGMLRLHFVEVDFAA